MLQFAVMAGMMSGTVFIPYVLYLRRKIHKTKRQALVLNVQLLKEKERQQALTEQLLALQEKISQGRLVDPLTALPSRTLFEDRLTFTVNQSIRHQLTCSVLFLDLDGFQIINDALGYEVGDKLLQETAKRLLTCVRQADTISRFAGDEFVFVFSQIAKAETVMYIAQRLLDAVSQPFIIDNQALYVTATIGIAVFPTDGHDGKTLLKNADLALHQAKTRGCNTYQFYREAMHASSRRELILNSSLHHDSIYQALRIYYQPQFNVETKQVTSMEASLCWLQAEFGLIKFEEFSRIAENNGRIIAINEWLLRNACQQLVKWQHKEFEPKSIAVKISLKQLENSHFIQKLAGILQEANLKPGSVTLEIAEVSLQNKIELAEKMLHRLKRFGVQIAVNHFGAGYLPLQYLRRLPIDIFKIDAALVQDVPVNKESEAIVKMIIALANSLQRNVIAEGVASHEQKTALYNLGCVIMQGELFSQPSLASEFTAHFVQRISENV